MSAKWKLQAVEKRVAACKEEVLIGHLHMGLSWGTHDLHRRNGMRQLGPCKEGGSLWRGVSCGEACHVA